MSSQHNKNCTKAKGPAQQRRALTEIQHRNGIRLRHGRAHSSTPSELFAVAGRDTCCPICSGSHASYRLFGVTFDDQVFRAMVCALCIDAIKANTAYRGVAGHRLAQQEQFRGDCHG